MDPLGHLIAWCAEYGLLGLFLVALLERLVPVVPPYGLLVAIGIGSASGVWHVPRALLATIAGSVVGGAAFYIAAAKVGADRSVAFLVRFARLFGVSSRRMVSLISYYRQNHTALSFGAQLIPTIRLIAPASPACFAPTANPFCWPPVAESLSGTVCFSPWATRPPSSQSPRMRQRWHCRFCWRWLPVKAWRSCFGVGPAAAGNERRGLTVFPQLWRSTAHEFRHGIRRLRIFSRLDC